MTRSQFYCLLICCLMFCGCPEKPQPGSQAPGESGTTEVPQVQPDDPVAVEALEKLGVHLKKNEQGQVTSADCFEANIEDKDLIHFEKLPALTTLSLENGKITDAGMETVAKLKQVTSLRLQKCSQLTIEGLKRVEALQDLERLYILYTYTTNECLEPISHLTKLKVLDLRGTKVTDAGVVHLAGMTSLVDLKFRSDAITDAALEDVGKLTNLRSLSLEDCGIRNAGMPALANLTELRSLNLMRTFVGDKGLEACSKMTKLEYVNLRDTAFGGPGLDYIAGSAGTLKELDLGEILISSDGVEHVAQFTNLEILSLWNGTFEDAAFAKLAALTKLKDLDLEGCNQYMTDEAMQTVAQFKDLEKLKLKQTLISDTGLEYLAGLKNLKELSLEQAQTSPSGVKKFQEAHPECKIKQ